MQLLHFSNEQRNVIANIAQTVAGQLLEIEFSDPAKDHQAIRHHAYLLGKLTVLREIHTDNFPAPENQNESGE